MSDQLITYLSSKLGDQIIHGTEKISLLLWGNRVTYELLGFTLTTGISDITEIESIESNPFYNKLFAIGERLAAEADIPFLSLFYHQNLDETSCFYIQDTSGIVSFDFLGFPEVLKSKLGVTFGSTGTDKPVNKNTHDSFHDWSRAYMPAECGKIDMDAIILNNRQEPRFVVEVKRSAKIKVGEWTPFKNDMFNYVLSMTIASKCRLIFLTLHHEGVSEVSDVTKISTFKINEVNPRSGDWIKYSYGVLQAHEVVKGVTKE